MSDPHRFSLKDIVEIIGIVALVLSLLLVAYEVRQSNRIAQATTTYELGRDVNQFNELGYSDPEFAGLLIKLRDVGREPTPVEFLQTRLLALRFLNLWTVQEAAYENGLFTKEQYQAIQVDVVTVMEAFPSLIPHWREVFEIRPDLYEHRVLRPLIEVLNAIAEPSDVEEASSHSSGTSLRETRPSD